MNRGYEAIEPTREAVDGFAGETLLEFGNEWCGHCRAAQALIESAIAGREGLRHLKIADASGRRLGRSFRVKLWPTLVFLRDGREVAKVVRPRSVDEIRAALARLDAQ